MDSKTYIPAPAKPQGFDAAVDAICGRTLTGKSKVRVVWGWDCRCFRNDKHDALKYPNPKMLNRWIVEQWVPAAFFGSKKQWEANRYHTDPSGTRIDLIGEYPYDGSYIMIQPLLAPDGGYTPLGENVITFINMMRREFESRIDGAYSGVKLKLQMEALMAADEAELNAAADAEIEDFKTQWRKDEHKINNPAIYSKNLHESSILWTPNSKEKSCLPN